MAHYTRAPTLRNPSYIRNPSLPCTPTPRSWTTALRRATVEARLLEPLNDGSKFYKPSASIPEEGDPFFSWELVLFYGNTEASILQPFPPDDNREDRIKRIPHWKTWVRPENKIPALTKPEGRRETRYYFIAKGYRKRGDHRSGTEGGIGIRFGFQRRANFVPTLESLEEVDERGRDRLGEMRWRWSVGLGGMVVIWAEEKEVNMPRPRNLCRVPIAAFEMDVVAQTPLAWKGEMARWMDVRTGGERRLVEKRLSERRMRLNDTVTIRALDGSVTRYYENCRQITAAMARSG